MNAPFKNLIAGEWAGSQNASRNINPSNTNDVVGEYAQGSVEDLNNAVAAAKAAFPAWSRTTPQERYEVLKKASDEILARKDELGKLLSREEGKTLVEGIGETVRAGQIFDFFAGECLRLAGEVLPSARPNIGVEITREPVGVVGIITPWNFPIAIPAWKIAPALAYGNSVVFKPADLVPGSAWALADIIIRAGAPEGVFNLVMGRGSVVGEALLNSPDVDAITFTGSVATGKKVAAAFKGVKAAIHRNHGLMTASRHSIDSAAFWFIALERCCQQQLMIEATGRPPVLVPPERARYSREHVGSDYIGWLHFQPIYDRLVQTETDMFD